MYKKKHSSINIDVFINYPHAPKKAFCYDADMIMKYIIVKNNIFDRNKCVNQKWSQLVRTLCTFLKLFVLVDGRYEWTNFILHQICGDCVIETDEDRAEARLPN